VAFAVAGYIASTMQVANKAILMTAFRNGIERMV